MQARPLAGVSILLLEDDPVIASLMRDFVNELGGDVVGLFRSIEAAEDFVADASHHIDLAILDYSVQGDYSTGLARRLRDKRIPLAFCTGYDAMSIPAEWRATPRLNKPFGVDDIAFVSRKALNSAL
jgi:DNA-binding LytR/AlgR family response regulator